MIIAKLIGGLGNQMFQYAAAKSLALKHSVDVKVDTTLLNSDPGGMYTQRYFELDIFDSVILVAAQNEINQFVNNKSTSINIIWRWFPFLFNRWYALESGSQYHQQYLNYPKNTYLDGFWQSELYFKDHEKEIRQEFTFKENIINKNKNSSNEIIKVNSISLHVRRGDYVKNSSANKFHGLCSLQYYNEAINYMSAKFNEIELFIFSDDIEWCKENFKYDFPVHFVETRDSHSDLYLMTQCKHNIIANSSFSWWGAWLNNNSNKVVIAPKQWFADSSVNTQDIIPTEWIKL